MTCLFYFFSVFWLITGGTLAYAKQGKYIPIHHHTWCSPTGFMKRVSYILAEWHIKKLHLKNSL